MAEYDETTQAPLPTPDPYDVRWELTVESRLNRITIVSYAAGGVGLGALVLAFLGFKAMNNLAKNLNQLAEVTQGLSNTVWPQAIQGDVQARPAQGVDETIHGGDPVSPAASGPGTGEASEEVKNLMASDPISPAQMARADGLAAPLRVNPSMDLPVPPAPGQKPYESPK